MGKLIGKQTEHDALSTSDFGLSQHGYVQMVNA